MKPFVHAALAAIGLAVLQPPAAARADIVRPSILFVLADDQSPFDFRSYNNASELDTPAIDRLAREGMVIDGAYHMGSFSGAVCWASRHMIMSGRTLWRLPVGPGDRGVRGKRLASQTIGAVFGRAGYATMRTCKAGNSYPAANAEFEVRRVATKRGGTKASGSAWHATQAIEFLDARQASATTKPFLLYLGFSHPHDTRDGTPGLLAKYGATNHRDPATLPPANPRQPALPPNYLPCHPFDNTHPGVRDEVAVEGVWANRDARTVRNEIGREYACAENIDRQLARVLDKLEETGELDNTYVFYTSDHGIAIGRHGLIGKQNLYEHTWRVPMIVRGPGIAPGSRARGNVYLLDLFATFCDLAGVEAPETNEGVSFQPVLLGQSQATREVLYGAYAGGKKPGIRCVRKGDWKLIKYDAPSSGVRQTQLFNLAANPHELLGEHQDEAVVLLTGVRPMPQQKNLAADAAHAEKRAEMEALLLAEMRRWGDPHRLWDQPPVSADRQGD